MRIPWLNSTAENSGTPLASTEAGQLVNDPPTIRLFSVSTDGEKFTRIRSSISLTPSFVHLAASRSTGTVVPLLSLTSPSSAPVIHPAASPLSCRMASIGRPSCPFAWTSAIKATVFFR